MKNWNTLEADVDLIMNTHYTPGRNGRQIDKVIIHHNAGNLTIRGCYDVWPGAVTTSGKPVQLPPTTKSKLTAQSASSCGIVTPPGMQATLPPTPPVSASNTPT